MRPRRTSRRGFLKSAAAAGAALSFHRPDPLFAQSSATVAVVGAGLAAWRARIAWRRRHRRDRLRGRGAARRPCFSLAATFPGQVVERGGELIDNLHKTMLGT